ncbi:phosphoribosyl-ATP pyrophosphatase [Solimonas aquatica]|uniref:Phosphoribosyl-ATP pyrophosphatase n=1 Tax=Solimonas aquatica TaxID=489703 RepID=A0A1H9ELY0_9GAMM|nr:phosphoribosyl-ATP diphosphatase [Solimonas aquatica]SEQ26597.1 phosphoribosyl-ATP pyrophosphatase [Solimonas aquatica]
MSAPQDVLLKLCETLEARKGADAKTSYVASLYAKGVDGIAKKIGEEAAETIIAAKNDDDQALIRELADLWFHSLVLMAHRGLTLQQLGEELARRSGTSGHAEKAARPQ